MLRLRLTSGGKLDAAEHQSAEQSDCLNMADRLSKLSVNGNKWDDVGLQGNEAVYYHRNSEGRIQLL